MGGMKHDAEDESPPNDAQERAEARREVTEFLMNKYGPLLTKKDLVTVLSYASDEAFERSAQRGLLAGLKLIQLPGRRGVFSLAGDVADFLTGFPREAQAPRGPAEECAQ